MTLQASGQISFDNVNTEVGNTSGTLIGMDWIRSVAKSTVGGSTGVSDMNTLHDKAYYQNNVSGNCNNGNCAVGSANCGNINCINCQIAPLANCLNCDTQKYLQPNCNCNPTYNCTQSQVSYNCNCDCEIWCPCW